MDGRSASDVDSVERFVSFVLHLSSPPCPSELNLIKPVTLTMQQRRQRSRLPVLLYDRTCL